MAGEMLNRAGPWGHGGSWQPGVGRKADKPPKCLLGWEEGRTAEGLLGEMPERL